MEFLWVLFHCQLAGIKMTPTQSTRRSFVLKMAECLSPSALNDCAEEGGTSCQPLQLPSTPSCSKMDFRCTGANIRFSALCVQQSIYPNIKRGPKGDNMLSGDLELPHKLSATPLWEASCRLQSHRRPSLLPYFSG